jgi:hypothetical protein
MSDIVDFTNRIFTDITTILLLPFRGLPPLWGLAWLSLLAGVCMILVFKGFSNQEAIGSLRKKMGAQALGMLLFISNPVTVLSMAGKLILSNFAYLWLIMKPLLVIAVPFVILMGQLDARYGKVPVSQLEEITVTLVYSDDLPEGNSFDVECGNAELIEPFVFIPTLGEVSFRIRPEGHGIIILDTGGVSFTLGDADRWSGAVSIREFDTETPFSRIIRPWNAKASIYSISSYAPSKGRIDLPARRYDVLDGRWSWLTVLLVFSSLSALAGALVFRVKI